MTSIAWGTRILAVSLLITLVFVSGCILDFGKNNLDFGNSGAAQEALACFCQTYGDPATYNGPPRLIAPLVSTEIRDNIPQDKVTRFSTDTSSIFFWVIYQNFPQGDDLHLSWIFQDKVVTTITRKTGSRTGVAFGEFVRPVASWPVGTHTITIAGGGNSTQVTFAIANSPTERTVFDFTSPGGVSCPDLISIMPGPQLPDSTNDTPWEPSADSWISGQTSDSALSCYPPVYSIRFMGSTGPAVTPSTQVQLKLFNLPNASTQEILLGSTTTENDGAWEYTWNGNVPGYMLKNGLEYGVKAALPDGTYTKMSFLYQCSDPEGTWQIYGGPAESVLSCSPPIIPSDSRGIPARRWHTGQISS